jgi:glycosyltransferase involved in cell wall biosynthesis
VRCPGLHEIPSPAPGKTGWPWTEESPRLQETKLAGQSWPRVSIVTPSYNQGQFLEETIRSVLLQGYPDLEYVILDGGSTDASLDIIRKYEPWLAYWVSEPDRGQTHAINKGWAHATGDILAYINADDYYLPCAILTAAREFCATPAAGMVYGSALIIDEREREVRTWEARPFDLVTMLRGGSVVPQPATFFSRDALEAVGHLDERWQMIMDYELCIRIGMRSSAVSVPKPLAKFRDHPASKSRLRAETTVNEVAQLVSSFRPEGIPPRKWRAIKRATMARLHYELALYYLIPGQADESRALRQILRSLVFYPPFALKRPMLTAHVAKRWVAQRLKLCRSPIA